MRDDAPTERQAQILRVIGNWIADHGEGPSIRQIGQLVGLSSIASVAYQLGKLEERGLISRSDRRWRSVRLGS
jgi:SOS-response transcriptional repressor LexA